MTLLHQHKDGWNLRAVPVFINDGYVTNTPNLGKCEQTQQVDSHLNGDDNVWYKDKSAKSAED
jgi:hypothetical protein